MLQFGLGVYSITAGETIYIHAHCNRKLPIPIAGR